MPIRGRGPLGRPVYARLRRDHPLHLFTGLVQKLLLVVRGVETFKRLVLQCLRQQGPVQPRKSPAAAPIQCHYWLRVEDLAVA